MLVGLVFGRGEKPAGYSSQRHLDSPPGADSRFLDDVESVEEAICCPSANSHGPRVFPSKHCGSITRKGSSCPASSIQAATTATTIEQIWSGPAGSFSCVK